MRTARIVTGVIWGVGVPCVVACGLWGLRSAPSEQRLMPALELPQSPGELPEQGRRAIDREAFAARIWNPPVGSRAADPSASGVSEHPKAPKVQLIAIINEGNGLLRAAIYDVESDRILIVAAGDRIAGHTVTQVEAKAVEISNGASATRLLLREGRS